MFKLVVLLAVVAVVAAKPKPGYLGGLALHAPVSYVAPAVAIPSAVSHSYRTDVISKPLIATYAAPALVHAPILHKTIVAAPALHAAPWGLGLGASIHPW